MLIKIDYRLLIIDYFVEIASPKANQKVLYIIILAMKGDVQWREVNEVRQSTTRR